MKRPENNLVIMNEKLNHKLSTSLRENVSLQYFFVYLLEQLCYSYKTIDINICYKYILLIQTITMLQYLCNTIQWFPVL